MLLLKSGSLTELDPGPEMSVEDGAEAERSGTEAASKQSLGKPEEAFIPGSTHQRGFLQGRNSSHIPGS